MRKRQKFTISRFICPGCQKEMPLPRMRQREKGHIKDIWCPFCQTKQKFTEIRSQEFYKNYYGELLFERR